MSNVALVVIFNHRYEKNVPKLEGYYSPRFANRHYLMPFAESKEPHVLRVIENGWCFSGHVAQAAARFQSSDVTHYAFVGDDLILNPALDQNNLVEALGLQPRAGYIKSLASADGVRFRWPWAIYAYRALKNAKFDFSKELPPNREAAEKFRALGLTFRRPFPRWKDRKWRKFPLRHTKLRELHWNLKFIKPYLYSLEEYVSSFGKPSDYPLLAGYSDFFVVPAEDLDRFAHFCGVFAAMNMFAEVAVPTALALACSSVKTEIVLGEHFADAGVERAPDATLRGVEYWESEIHAFCKELGFDWNRLLATYPADVLYFHPVKLSQWK